MLSLDQKMRPLIWNVVTGQCVAGPFHGHTGCIWSVLYSPDGCHIVSGSEDMTIRVWSVATSQSVAGPFVGHTDQVHCVAYYSSDGTHIVSGSWDKTIRVWNAITTQCVAGPFQGHTNLVTSVAFSPDGGQIITGSADCSIKVWSVHKFASLDDFHEEDGWIWSSNIGYLGWLAPWNRNAFQLPIQSLVISPYSTYQVETSDSPFLGESWTSCWH